LFAGKEKLRGDMDELRKMYEMVRAQNEKLRDDYTTLHACYEQLRFEYRSNISHLERQLQEGLRVAEDNAPPPPPPPGVDHAGICIRYGDQSHEYLNHVVSDVLRGLRIPRGLLFNYEEGVRFEKVLLVYQPLTPRIETSLANMIEEARAACAIAPMVLLALWWGTPTGEPKIFRQGIETIEIYWTKDAHGEAQLVRHPFNDSSIARLRALMAPAIPATMESPLTTIFKSALGALSSFGR
jgi:hypothetical protein